MSSHTSSCFFRSLTLVYRSCLRSILENQHINCHLLPSSCKPSRDICFCSTRHLQILNHNAQYFPHLSFTIISLSPQLHQPATTSPGIHKLNNESKAAAQASQQHSGCCIFNGETKAVSGLYSQHKSSSL